MAATIRPALYSSDELRAGANREEHKKQGRNRWLGAGSMKRRDKLLQTCAIGLALSSAALLSSGAFAQTAPSANDAWAQALPMPWWFHGTIEAGGRFFLNNPQRNGSRYLNQDSLAKYYEYSDIRPGPFGNIWLSAGSQDGVYQVDLGGKNIGYDDQSYYLDFSQAGTQYFSASWDQSPHLYSTSALTPYLGVGTNALTLGTTVAATANYPQLSFYQTDIGIERNTASAEYRWTPSDAWDVKADYSHLRRTGTQVAGITGLAGSAFSGATQIPAPVNDSTQNYGLNGEYVGTSPWGQRFSFKLGYTGSQYIDDYDSYTVRSPLTAGFTGGTVGRMSMPPSNQANGFNGTLAMDLPLMSRYVGTVAYTMMRQDEAFLPMSNNANPPLPAASLNGQINTFLSNNVITTKITPELTSKLNYRYYDFQNDTPELQFPNGYIRWDGTAFTASRAINSLSMNYTRQNVGEALTWRPSAAWTFGAIYGFERYDRVREAVNATNENSGKLTADWKPTNWFGVRSSGSYADRRFDTYDHVAFINAYQFYPATNLSFSRHPAYRQYNLNNRTQWKSNVAVDIVALPGLTITPTFKYLDEDYSVDPQNQMGLKSRRSYTGGVDATYMFNPNTSLMVGYYREYYTQLLIGINSTSPTASPGGVNYTETDDKTSVDTFVTVLRHAVIPDTLDTELRYTWSRGVTRLKLYTAVGSGLPAGGQFPDSSTNYQRLDAIATYKFDPTVVAMLGWKGDVKAKLHYAWERNGVIDWANDTVAPYNPSWAANALWLAWANPNYNVHMLMASLAFTW